MNSMIMKKSLLAGIAVLSLAVVLPVAANAQNAHAEEAQQNRELRQGAVHQTLSEHKEAAKLRLAGAKLNACQNRQKAITNIMTRLANRGQKQADLFTTIATRTESFYISEGKTLANYDALVADVTAKKAAAETMVSTITSDSTTFDCTADNPKGMVTNFRGSLKSEISALKAYKTAVKNLIVGVKSVQSTTISSQNSTTPDAGGQQ